MIMPGLQILIEDFFLTYPTARAHGSSRIIHILDIALIAGFAAIGGKDDSDSLFQPQLLDFRKGLVKKRMPVTHAHKNRARLPLILKSVFQTRGKLKHAPIIRRRTANPLIMMSDFLKTRLRNIPAFSHLPEERKNFLVFRRAAEPDDKNMVEIFHRRLRSCT